MRRKLLFVLRHPPQAGIRVRETLDMLLTAAAFDQAVSLLFLDDGVYQLKRGQRPEAAGLPAVAEWYDTLELYDVDEVRVERESLEERGLTAEALRIPVRLVARGEVAGLIAAHDLVIGG